MQHEAFCGVCFVFAFLLSLPLVGGLVNGPGVSPNYKASLLLLPTLQIAN